MLVASKSLIYEGFRDVMWGIPQSAARLDIITAVRQSPDDSDVLEACGLAQTEHPVAYKAFLEAAE
jgi:hypothetical protein